MNLLNETNKEMDQNKLQEYQNLNRIPKNIEPLEWNKQEINHQLNSRYTNSKTTELTTNTSRSSWCGFF